MSDVVNMVRAEYRAALCEGVDEKALAEAFDVCRAALEMAKGRGELYTGGVFRYRSMLFAYLEYLTDAYLEYLTDGRLTETELRDTPERWFSALAPFLKLWPERDADRHWAYMLPVFWFDEPKGYGHFARALPPEKRCGRIAELYPDRAMNYICHHQAIVREGLLTGDRYQFISVHENILFSYFETPRDRERVNIRRAGGRSIEAEKWAVEDPDSHFKRFPESPDENFHIIETVIEV